MKRVMMKTAAFIAAASLLLPAAVSGGEQTGTDNHTIAMTSRTEYLGEWEQDGDKYLCEYQYPVISVGSGEAEEYPELCAALEEMNGEIAENMKAEYEADLAEAREMARDNPENFMTHTRELRFYVQRADAHAVSLLGTVWAFLGGVHGTSAYMSRNFDPKSGKELALGDVVTDVGALRELLVEQLEETYDYMDWSEPREALDVENADKWVWTVGYDGIGIYFGNYELGSYAEGMQTAFIPYAGNEDIFNGEYLDVPSAYGVQLLKSGENGFDLDGDGQAETVSVSGVFDEYAYKEIDVSAGGSTLKTDDIYCYDFDSTLVCSGDIRAVYVEVSEDNDYAETYCYKLDDSSSPKFAPSLAGVIPEGRYGELIDGDSWSRYVLTDPDCFLLDTRADMLSTLSASRPYTVGEDGMPEPLSDWYEFQFTRTLTAKQDFEAELVGEDGSGEGSFTVPAGTELTLLRTDDENWTDATTPDGKIVRITVDSNKWPRTVGGTEIDDLFEGMVFAG